MSLIFQYHFSPSGLAANEQSTSGQTIAADCLGWLESVSQPGYISYTIFGGTDLYLMSEFFYAF
jgi:hypothetical protein